MDIELFSDMVKDLILDNDEVTLPGLGTFVSEVMPSTFSDRGYTINPPYRKLSFRQRGGEDNRLAQMYAKANSTDLDSAKKILADYISDLKKTLQTKKMVAVPGLGRLRATKENAFFFIPDEDLDVYQYGFGLEPVSLKTHEETPEEVSAAVASLRSILDEPLAEEPASEPVPEDETPEAAPVEHEVSAEPENPTEPEPVVSVESEDPTESEPVPEAPATQENPTPENPEPKHPLVESYGEDTRYNPKRKTKKKKPMNRTLKVVLIVLLSLIIMAAVLLGVFVLLAHVAPDFIDSILYTPEELEIINY